MQDERAVLEVDLARLARGEAGAVVRRPAPAGPPAVARVAGWGGSALALAIVWEAREEPEAPLVIAAGDAVRRGLPTAARACVASRAPLTGRYADGHVGGELGRALAPLAGALVLLGRARPAGAVLHLAADGAVALVPAPELEGRSTRARLAHLRARFPRAALLACGPAGDAEVPFASLANEADPPSFVGRGGLGAVLGRLGLRAIAVDVASHAAGAADAGVPAEITRRLAASPRLRARAAGGTLEVAGAFAARGDPSADGLARAVDAAPEARKGCAGCPTPCGWVFERPAGSQGARFGALQALGPPLGLDGLDAPLALLERCDELACDAKEAGAALALLCDAAEAGAWDGASARGDLARLLQWLDAIPARRGPGPTLREPGPTLREPGALLALGAERLAARLGLQAAVARGQAARAERDLASLLGQCVSTRGADPMRTFAFLAADVADRARLERLLAPWPVPRGAEDPRSPAGKGRLVAWHEAFLAAVDATGFCAFSAAGLVADGVADLDALARWIAPASLRADLGEDGRALLAAGASIALLQRDLARAWGGRAEDDLPAFARERLLAPGLFPEYARWRGLAPDGGPSPEAWSRLATRAVLDLAPVEPGETPPPEVRERGQRRRGRVRFTGAGPVGALLATGARAAPGAEAVEGGTVELEHDLPAPLLEVVEHLAAGRPGARFWLLSSMGIVPSCWRAGERLGPTGLVHDGDVIDLVVALSGG